MPTIWKDIESDLLGYRYGTPRSVGLIDGFGIDQETAESEICQECGSPCEFVPMTAPGSYRAFARCTNPACQTVIEF